ncbi:uncharacterized protein ACIB01_017170 isoform 1-T1 [Guaruba guarouba]
MGSQLCHLVNDAAVQGRLSHVSWKAANMETRREQGERQHLFYGVLAFADHQPWNISTFTCVGENGTLLRSLVFPMESIFPAPRRLDHLAIREHGKDSFTWSSCPHRFPVSRGDAKAVNGDGGLVPIVAARGRGHTLPALA